MVTGPVRIYRVKVPDPRDVPTVLFVREDKLGPWRALPGAEVTPLGEEPYTPMVTPGSAT